MARRCEICGKGTTNGNRISIERSQVSRRAKIKVKANIKKVRVKDEHGNTKTVKACTKCIANNKVK